jgi:outer membrane protein assembly factor BamB
MPARFVLAIADRAIVHGRQWHLVDATTGRSLANDRLGGGPIVIDQALKGFITHYTSAHLSVRRLADGKELFKYLPGQGDVYTRAFLTRHGGRLLILGWERALDPHGHKKAENSRIEILDLGMPPKADGFGFLTSSKEVGELYIKELGVQMATAGATIVAAAKNEFYRMNWDLQVTEVLEGNFDPQGLSLDEAGNTYMALAAGGTNHVWKLTPKGEIAYDFTLPGPGIVLETPPIVGYDHTVYQLASQQIYAIGDNGKLRWSRTAEGGVGGAAITGDGHLLVSEGSCIVAYDAKGDRRKVHCFPNETLTSPPILNESGNLMVTSKTSLHCLQGVGK